jgi:hypothetical protein
MQNQSDPQKQDPVVVRKIAKAMGMELSALSESGRKVPKSVSQLTAEINSVVAAGSTPKEGPVLVPNPELKSVPEGTTAPAVRGPKGRFYPRLVVKMNDVIVDKVNKIQAARAKTMDQVLPFVVRPFENAVAPPELAGPEGPLAPRKGSLFTQLLQNALAAQADIGEQIAKAIAPEGTKVSDLAKVLTNTQMHHLQDTLEGYSRSLSRVAGGKALLQDFQLQDRFDSAWNAASMPLDDKTVLTHTMVSDKAVESRPFLEWLRDWSKANLPWLEQKATETGVPLTRLDQAFYGAHKGYQKIMHMQEMAWRYCVSQVPKRFRKWSAWGDYANLVEYDSQDKEQKAALLQEIGVNTRADLVDAVVRTSGSTKVEVNQWSKYLVDKKRVFYDWWVKNGIVPP